MNKWSAFFVLLLSCQSLFAVPANRGGALAGRSPAMSRSGGAPQQVERRSIQNPYPQGTLRRQNYQDIQHSERLNNVAADQSRQQIFQNYPNHGNWYGNQFYRDHHLNNYGYNAWRGADWGAVNSWVGDGWSEPYYYDYPQQQQPIIVQNYTTYIPQTPQPVQAPVQTQPVETPQQSYLPLGVFAAAQDPTQAAFSNMFVQLALDKQGNVEGSYYNATTDQAHPLRGSVAKGSQVVQWEVADNNASPIMQTGLYNLSQDTTPIQVHFPDQTTQVWYLVKLTQQQETELQQKKLQSIN